MKWPAWFVVLGIVVATANAVAQEGDAPLFAEDSAAEDAGQAEATEADEQAAEEASDAAEAGPEEEAEPDAQQLAERAAELNRQLRAVQNELRQMQGARGRRAPEDLEGIVLPENPTREDVEAYVKELEEATQGQNSFSTADPQVDKLAQIPPEHIDLLIAQTTGRSSLRFHAQYAMREMDLGILRERIGPLVRQQPAMIGIVVMQGWSGDARDAIADRINQRPPNLGIAWFQAASELNDPALFDAIHDCAVQTRYFAQVVPMLEGMPGYDLERTVAEVWQRVNAGSSGMNAYQVATIAVRFGYVDALGEMIKQLDRYSSYHTNGENTQNHQRVQVMRYIDFTGTNDEITAWFDEHRDALIFDHVAQRFLLPEEIERF